MRGVVLDFFGTLTDPGREASRRAVYDTTAAALGVPAEALWAEVTATFTLRATGRFGGTRETVLTVARRCGEEPTEQRLTTAVAAHHEGATALHAPRPGALRVLAELRERGFRLAVLSDCSSELCELWDSSPYAPLVDAAVLSWAEGYRKPDPRGYRKAAAALGAPPQECWFVGDGGSRELAGARDAGLRPVLVTNAAYPDAAGYRDDPDAFVPDAVLDDLDGLPELVGHPG